MSKILVVDDEELMTETIRKLLSKRGYKVEIFSNPITALNVLQREKFDIVLTDFKMPNIDGLEMIDRIRELRPEAKIILMTAYSSIPNAVEAIKRGASEYITKPFEWEELEEKINNIGGKKHSKQTRPSIAGFDLVGESQEIKELKNKIQRIGPSSATVLIRGESGSGKELVARQLHLHSDRAHQPFVPINMAAIPENLMESEFFGYKKGSFTGADQDTQGKFMASNEGTLFMDEISEMPLSFQAKLLRVLQDFQIMPIGDTLPVHVNCRVLAATNSNIEEMISDHRFREDLYYRLNIIEIEVPNLRNRMEDLPLLVEHFLQKHASEEMNVDSEFISVLRAYHWPGNVRELENIIHRCVVLSDGNLLDKYALPKSISGLQPKKETPLTDIAFRQLKEGKSLSEIEKEIILKAIDESFGNKTNAAKILKITRRKLYSRLEKHGIQI
ncbi:MAG: sigma-54 dependent transcriptional regulator [bacterium]|nr:sigma-54 dependent transcriptional regulator [bacterium]